MDDAARERFREAQAEHRRALRQSLQVGREMPIHEDIPHRLTFKPFGALRAGAIASTRIRKAR
jgi:hypothetical protein